MLNFFELRDSFYNHFSGANDISVVVYANGDGAAQIAGGGIVGDAGLEDFLIGNVDHAAIVGSQRGGTKLDLGDGAFVAVDNDLIANVERTCSEQNYA